MFQFIFADHLQWHHVQLQENDDESSQVFRKTLFANIMCGCKRMMMNFYKSFVRTMRSIFVRTDEVFRRTMRSILEELMKFFSRTMRSILEELMKFIANIICKHYARL